MFSLLCHLFLKLSIKKYFQCPKGSCSVGFYLNTYLRWFLAKGFSFSHYKPRSNAQVLILPIYVEVFVSLLRLFFFPKKSIVTAALTAVTKWQKPFSNLDDILLHIQSLTSTSLLLPLCNASRMTGSVINWKKSSLSSPLSMEVKIGSLWKMLLKQYFCGQEVTGCHLTWFPKKVRSAE